MTNALVTIFIPTYKRPYLLQKAIESALNQTVSELRVLVCDNASGDETGQIVTEIAKRDARVQYICHAQNIGMLANYAFGISKIQTPYFSILSDDDMLLPCFCETALNGFAEFPGIAFFACSTLMITKNDGVFRVPLEDWPREGLFLPQDGLPTMIGKYPVPTTVLFSSEIARNVQIDFTNLVAWDCDFLIQLASRFPFAISKKPCGIFVYHPDSFSGSLTRSRSFDSILRLITAVQRFSWLDKHSKSTICALLREDYYKIACIHIDFNFSIQHLAQVSLICWNLLSRSFIRRRVFYYLIISLLCRYIPHFYSLFPARKTPHIKEVEKCKQFSEMRFDLTHFEKAIDKSASRT